MLLYTKYFTYRTERTITQELIPTREPIKKDAAVPSKETVAPANEPTTEAVTKETPNKR